ncbi:MAG: hypothetical protein BWY75_01951 [bacterium ADurb.Bin425]|nr:MAG: hypothetical protein BWY75_01951 [bacterium ADurb.Bin425]
MHADAVFPGSEVAVLPHVHLPEEGMQKGAEGVDQVGGVAVGETETPGVERVEGHEVDERQRVVLSMPPGIAHFLEGDGVVADVRPTHVVMRQAGSAVRDQVHETEFALLVVDEAGHEPATPGVGRNSQTGVHGRVLGEAQLGQGLHDVVAIPVEHEQAIDGCFQGAVVTFHDGDGRMTSRAVAAQKQRLVGDKSLANRFQVVESIGGADQFTQFDVLGLRNGGSILNQAGKDSSVHVEVLHRLRLASTKATLGLR